MNSQQATLTGIPNGILAIILTIAVEVMFFGGLISAFLIQSLGTAIWPPPGQPVLNNIVTNINTAFLIISGISIQFAVYFVDRGRVSFGKNMLFLTTVLGIVFLAIQGYEWINLIGFGFTTTSSNLGSFFYIIIGVHALHVLVGVIVLVYMSVMHERYNSGNKAGLEMIRLYWSFVVLLWPILYSLVYFN